MTRKSSEQRGLPERTQTVWNDPSNIDMPEQNNYQEPKQLNTNTGISVGLFVVLIAGILWIVNALGGIRQDNTSGRNEAQAQFNNFKMEVTQRFDSLSLKVAALESNKDAVTSTEFFRWAVHLQQLNQDPRKLQTEGLKVPEPEVATKK
jgi:hypothetical protein